MGQPGQEGAMRFCDVDEKLFLLRHICRFSTYAKQYSIEPPNPVVALRSRVRITNRKPGE
jgi:hypothetical protein